MARDTASLFRSHSRGGEAVRESLPSSGDAIPGHGESIAVYVHELSQLFNSMDPSPFHMKDLDDDAEEYILASARELGHRSPAALVVYLNQAIAPPGGSHDGRVIGEAIRSHFARREQLLRWTLHELIRRGLISLLIGLAALAAFLSAGEALRSAIGGTAGSIAATSLHIGGWVAMWNPMEIFLYEWWPIVSDRRLMRRLSRMPVQVVYTADGAQGT